MAICFACCSTIMAQQAKIGFFSMQDLLNTDVTYQEAIANVQVLKQQYANEQKIAEQDFKDVAYFEPFYLKEFIATVAKNPLKNEN